MGNIINKIVENNALFAGVIALLCIVLVVLVILIIKSAKNSKKINIYEEDLEDEDIKKVKNVKKEDIIEIPDVFEKEENVVTQTEEQTETLEDELNEDSTQEEAILELEKKYDEEKEKEIEEVKEETKNNELAELISKMEEDSKLKPEEIVANFEEEQEAQSIISYKELVNAVKNRQEEYEDELEGKPLSTVSTIMEEIGNQSEKVEEEIEEVEKTDDKEEVIEETKEDITEKKFKKTDVISPVFGIVQDNEDTEEIKEQTNTSSDRIVDLRDTNLDDENFINLAEGDDIDNESLTALDEIYKQMADDLFKANDELTETPSLDALSTNEEFLQSLKDFRKNL